MAQIVLGMAAEDDTVGAEQSGRADFLVGGPARRTVGLDVLRLARPQNRQSDGERDGDESPRCGDKGAFDEHRGRIGIVGIPPPKERRRVIDRYAQRQFEPGLPELRLKPSRQAVHCVAVQVVASTTAKTMAICPQRIRFPDMTTPIGLVMQSRSENKPPDERQSKTTEIAPPDTTARKSAGCLKFCRSSSGAAR